MSKQAAPKLVHGALNVVWEKLETLDFLARIVHKFNPNTPITCFLAWVSDFGLPERILVKRSMISGQSELESAELNSLIGKTFTCGGLWAPLAGFGSILG